MRCALPVTIDWTNPSASPSQSSASMEDVPPVDRSIGGRQWVCLALACWLTCAYGFIAPCVAADAIDTSPLPYELVPAFPNLEWKDWEFDRNGVVTPIRPILLTNAGDGSKRIFVPTQQGTVHMFRPDSKQTEIFFDITDRVRYLDTQNEEGLLGMAFHPQFKTNGEVYVYYIAKDLTPDQKAWATVSRFHVSRTNPDRVDPASEERLLRIKQPYWNHNGGTICFGNDGFLYIVLGDGGNQRDPHNNGQNLKTWLGKVLRIDVDHREGTRPYAIPADNPFRHFPGAKPEIFAYGCRNIWRLSVDRETGLLWAADVGEKYWEEINLIQKGGNYGWSIREGREPFEDRGIHHSPDLIDPIFVYDHDAGKSITGGGVYRGKLHPELVGHYLYGDYVTGRVWGLKYDPAAKKVLANHKLVEPKSAPIPIVSFGEDEDREMYLTAVMNNPQCIFKLRRTK